MLFYTPMTLLLGAEILHHEIEKHHEKALDNVNYRLIKNKTNA